MFSNQQTTKSGQQRARVCVIGAGPSGMSALYQYAKLTTGNKPEVVCYEKQGTWGGMWNFTWMTGTDEFGEVCHNGMYKHLWINAPKECFEWSDYTFKEHFAKPTPSFLPLAPMRSYIESLWTKKPKVPLKNFIKFNHAVRYVKYNQDLDCFNVSISDLKGDKVLEETFSHVICATGIFWSPNKPCIPGIEEFQGRVIHSHDFREASEFKGQRILVVGGSFSAEDIAIQCVKYGAKSAICSWHQNPMNLKWPRNIDERPNIKRVLPGGVEFTDGKTAEVDAVILCTGYVCRFPFLEENLQLRSPTSFYPENLYKGILWMKGGNSKMFYMGVQNQLYSLPMFNVQATWIWRFITGNLQNEPRNAKEMKADVEKWLARNGKIDSKHDVVEFQSEYLEDLIEATGHEKKITNAKELFHSWLRARDANIATFRDENYPSIHTGQMASKTTPWMQNFEEDIEKLCNAKV